MKVNIHIISLLFLGFITNTGCQNVRPALTKDQIEKAAKYIEELSSHKRGWVDHNMDFFGLASENEAHDIVQKLDVRKQLSEDVPGVKKIKLEQHGGSNNKVTAHLPHAESSFVDDSDVSIREYVKEFEDNIKEPSIRNLDSFFLGRWLKRIIKVDQLKEMNTPWRKIISFPLTDTQISRLETIIQNPKHSLIDVEEVIMDIMSHLKVSDEEGIGEGIWQMKVLAQYLWLQNDKVQFAAVMFIVLLVLVYIFHFCPHPKTCVFFIIVVITIGFQWKQLYQKAVAEKAAKLDEANYSSACKKNDFGFFESLQFYFSSWFVSRSSCTEYYEAHMVDPLWEVNLMEAISLAFSKCLFAPMKSFAQALNKSTKFLLLDLSAFEISILMVFIFLFLLMYFKYKIRLPWFFAVIEPAFSNGNNWLSSLSNHQLLTPSSASNQLPAPSNASNHLPASSNTSNHLPAPSNTSNHLPAPVNVSNQLHDAEANCLAGNSPVLCSGCVKKCTGGMHKTNLKHNTATLRNRKAALTYNTCRHCSSKSHESELSTAVCKISHPAVNSGNNKSKTPSGEAVFTSESEDNEASDVSEFDDAEKENISFLSNKLTLGCNLRAENCNDSECVKAEDDFLVSNDADCDKFQLSEHGDSVVSKHGENK